MNWTTELNLNPGQSFLAPGLSYNGYYNGTNTSFPTLLTGSAKDQFQTSDQAVLQMAPRLSYVYGHDAGLMMFSGGNSTQWEISADAVTSAQFNGDGVSFYFMLTPVSTTNWSSDAYVASVTDGPSIAPCSGDVLFPYSTTPYFVVQWDPAYHTANCGAGSVGEFNVFSVDPNATGGVSPGSITTLGPIGTNSSVVPPITDVFNVTVGYKASQDEVEARAVDAANSDLLAYAALNLTAVNYRWPFVSSEYSYLAVAGAASDHTSWGLEYVGYTTSTEGPNATEPASFLTPFTAVPSSGSVGSFDWIPVLSTAAIGSVGALVVVRFGVLPVRHWILRRQGERLVADMNRVISEGGTPRSPR